MTCPRLPVEGVAHRGLVSGLALVSVCALLSVKPPGWGPAGGLDPGTFRGHVALEFMHLG